MRRGESVAIIRPAPRNCLRGSSGQDSVRYSGESLEPIRCASPFFGCAMGGGEGNQSSFRASSISITGMPFLIG